MGIRVTTTTEMSLHPDPIGLCRQCLHAREIPHPRGGPSYWTCALAAKDPRFPKYPRLPVLRCGGHEAK